MEKVTTVQIHTLGELLTWTMKDRGIGVREAAKALGTSPATVSRINHGGGFMSNLIIPIAKWCALNKHEDAEQLWELLEANQQ